MISSEVQRTLVKSPPELWAELSDPEALTRHLGALGEIRITRAEAEKLVEWEAEGTSGVVQIKASGWGTKVTLSVTRELEPAEEPSGGEHADLQEPQQADAEPSSLATAAPEVEPVEETPVVESEPATLEAESSVEQLSAPLSPAVVAKAEPQEGLAPEPQLATEPQRGFFARLFGRRHPRVAEQPTTPHEILPAASTEEDFETPTASSAIELLQARFAPAETPPVLEESEPAVRPTPEEPAQLESTATEEPLKDAGIDLAAELQAAEEVAAEEVTAVLTAVLDRLGAAHHRPFSRS